MKLEQAVRDRIESLIKERNQNLSTFSLNCGITPSTLFDFMYKETRLPNLKTINKICAYCNLSLAEFFDDKYFKNLESEN